MEDLAMIRIYFLEMKIVINTMCNLSIICKKKQKYKKNIYDNNDNSKANEIAMKDIILKRIIDCDRGGGVMRNTLLESLLACDEINE